MPRRPLLALLLAALFATLLAGPAAAQPAHPEAVIPNFWDPRARPEPVELGPGRTVRFLTSVDYPPLHFVGADGAPTGFSVDLARAACERLRVACTIQARPFDALVGALDAGEGDGIAAAFRITEALRARYAFTTPYFALPARFAARREAAAGLSIEALEGRRVAVVEGTAHEAWLEIFLPEVERAPHPTLSAAQEATAEGRADLVFADGLSLALWIGGRASRDCCAFVGGPIRDSRFFGEGVAFFFADRQLARAFDYALQKLWEEGVYGDVWLRYFPVSPF